jgi:hypothetical protein
VATASVAQIMVTVTYYLMLFLLCVTSIEWSEHSWLCTYGGLCKGNLTNLRRGLHLSLAKGNPK